MIINKKILDIKQFALNSNLKPEIAGVLFSNGKITATDSYRLVEIELKDKDNSIIEPTILNLKEVKATTSDTINILPDFKAEVSSKKKPAIVYPSYRVDGNYPEYAPIIPKTTPLASFQVNGELLGEVLAYMHQFSPVNGVTIDFMGKGKPLVIKCENVDVKVMGLVMGIKK